MRNIIFNLRVKKHWGDYYPLVEHIINSQVHSVTKVSPEQIMYGNVIDLEQSIFRRNIPRIMIRCDSRNGRHK